MTSTVHAERLRAMAFPRVFDAHKLIVGLVYLAAGRIYHDLGKAIALRGVDRQLKLAILDFKLG